LLDTSLLSPAWADIGETFGGASLIRNTSGWYKSLVAKLTHLKHFALNTAKNFIKIFPNSYYYSRFKLGGAVEQKSFLEG